MRRKLSFFLFLLVLMQTQVSSVFSLTCSWHKMPQNERLVLHFDGKIPPLKVSRTGYQELTLPLPSNFWKKEKKPQPANVSRSRFVKQIHFTNQYVQISLKERAIGFIFSPFEEEKQFIIDVFYDPVGNRWEPPVKHTPVVKKQPQKTQKKEVQPTPRPKTTPEQLALAPKIDVHPDPVGNKREAPAKNRSEVKKQPPTSQKKEEQPKPKPKATPEKAAPAPKKEKTTSVKKEAVIPAKKQVLPEKEVQKETPKGLIPSSETPPKKTDPSLPDKNLFKLRAKIQDTSVSEPAIFRSGSSSGPEIDNHPSQKNQQNQETPVSDQTPAPAKTDVAEKNTLSPAKEAAPKMQPQQSKEEAKKETSVSTQMQQADKTVQEALPEFASEAPPDTPEYYRKILKDAKLFLHNEDILQAFPLLEQLEKAKNLPRDIQEEVLYLYPDTLFQVSTDNFAENFQPIMHAYQKAINYNPGSPMVPHALLQMGHANLRVNNIPEAKGYFTLLKKKYPGDTNLPVIDFLWGNHFANKGDDNNAAESFQKVLLHYPEYKIALPSTIGLARALNNLNHDNQAREIMDYLKKRWSRAYITDPSLLVLEGIIAQKNNQLDTARDAFGLYYNLLPSGPDVDIALARLGDIALLQKKQATAKKLYEKTAEDFPDKEGGLIAQMRLAEEGIFDEPSIRDMFNVFDRPYNLRPEKIYRKIIKDYPKSPLAPVAQLKLAIWLLWQDNFKESLEEINNLLLNFPDSSLQKQAVVVGQKAFGQMVEEHAKEGRVLETAEFWKKYDFLRDEKKLKPEHRIALAKALWETGDPKESLRLAQPFLDNKTEKDQASELVLDLVLSIYTDAQNWEKITSLAPQITDWNLEPPRQRQADYALALAYENLGQNDNSQPLWKKLALDVGLEDNPRAYSLYFMAQHAYMKEDLTNVALFGQEALELLLRLTPPDEPKIKDTLDLLIRATEQSGRVQEALAWGLEYNKYLSADDDQWPAFTYRLANLYKINADIETWKKKLNELIDQAPQSIYSQMATSDLRRYELNKDLKRFS